VDQHVDLTSVGGRAGVGRRRPASAGVGRASG
jgi:hypothetical protein